MDVVSPLLTALCWVAAGLLILAGAAKLPVPDAAMATLHRLRLPSGRIAARLVGCGEVALGIGVIVVGGPLAAGALAVTYAVLLAVAWRQRAAQLDCGCFGVAAAPVSALHLGLNAAAAVVGLTAVAGGLQPLGRVAADAGAIGTVAALVLLGTGTALVRTVAVQAAVRLRHVGPSGAGT